MDLSVYKDVEATLDTTEEAQEVVSFVDAAENAVEMVVEVEAARRLPAAFFCTTQMIIRAELLISCPWICALLLGAQDTCGVPAT
jgi:hypothetical protein